MQLMRVGVLPPSTNAGDQRRPLNKCISGLATRWTIRPTSGRKPSNEAMWLGQGRPRRQPDEFAALAEWLQASAFQADYAGSIPAGRSTNCAETHLSIRHRKRIRNATARRERRLFMQLADLAVKVFRDHIRALPLKCKKRPDQP